MSSIIQEWSNIATIAAGVTALITLPTVLLSFLSDNIRKKRQSTIDYFSLINEETKRLIGELYVDRKQDFTSDKVKLNYVATVRRYLSLMERFSVGIRSHMYDVNVFDRMHGMTTIKMDILLDKYFSDIKGGGRNLLLC